MAVRRHGLVLGLGCVDPSPFTGQEPIRMAAVRADFRSAGTGGVSGADGGPGGTGGVLIDAGTTGEKAAASPTRLRAPPQKLLRADRD
jgi:hypothetical protein